MHPSADNALAAEVVVDIDQLPDSFKFFGVPSVAGHVKVDGEQAPPDGLVVLPRLPNIRDVARLIRGQKKRSPVTE